MIHRRKAGVHHDFPSAADGAQPALSGKHMSVESGDLDLDSEAVRHPLQHDDRLPWGHGRNCSILPQDKVAYRPRIDDPQGVRFSSYP